MKFLKEGFVKMFNFSGRTIRKDFWQFYIPSILFIFTGIEIGKYYNYQEVTTIILGFLFFFPMLSIQVRRLHDSGRTGWFLLLLLIPYIGPIILMILFCLSDPYENKYGSHPEYSGGNQSKKSETSRKEEKKYQEFNFKSTGTNEYRKDNSAGTDDLFSKINNKENKFCTNCGKPIILESKFCGNCGNKY